MCGNTGAGRVTLRGNTTTVSVHKFSWRPVFFWVNKDSLTKLYRYQERKKKLSYSILVKALLSPVTLGLDTFV